MSFKPTTENDSGAGGAGTGSTSPNKPSNLECYLITETYETTGIELPCYPDEVSETTSANWSDESIVGRSSPISAYTGTGYRSVSFTFTLHREMATNIELVLKALRTTVYPRYESKGLTPPISTFRFGNFYVRGIVRSISFVWKKPIIDMNYQACDVSVTIDSTPHKVMSATYLGSSLNPMGV